MQYNVSDLEKEIEALENEVFGTPEEESTEEVKAESVIQETTTQPQEDYFQKWKESEKRFNNYKGSTDLTIRDLRSDLASAKGKYANLQLSLSDALKRITELESKSASSVFTDEDKDILGESAVDSISKGVDKMLESKLKPLQDEVDRSRKALAEKELQEAKNLARTSYDKFISRLEKAVPDFEDVNVSPGFISYMKGIDELSGYPREYLFKKAEEALDVSRIAGFFKEFKDMTQEKKNPLEAAITPTGTSSSSAPTKSDNETQITRKFIEDFYNEFSRGKFKGKKGREEAARIEDMIDRAVMSGQVY